jgi:integrase
VAGKGISRRCGCRDAATGGQLGKRCPQLRNPRHGSWSYLIDLPGAAGTRRQQRRSGYATARKAERARDRVLARLNAGTVVDDRQTLGEYLDSWLAAKRRPRPTTRRAYTEHVEKHWKPAIGHLPLERVQPGHIEAVVGSIFDEAERKGRPIKPSSVARIVATLRSALGTAVKKRRLQHNAAAHIELPEYSRPKAVVWTDQRVAAWRRECERLAAERAKPGRTPRVTFEVWCAAPRPAVAVWTPKQLGLFLDAISHDRLAPLYELIAATGMRRGEICGLRWADLDLSRRLLVVHGQRVPVGYRVVEGPPKSRSGEDRLIELDDATTELRRHRQAQDAERHAWGTAYSDGDYVFCREDGSPYHPEYVTRHFAKLAYRAGLPPIRLHDLRHGEASLMLAAGVDMAVVSKRLGHSTITITSDTYAHLLEGVGRDAAERARALIPRQPRDHPVTTVPDSSDSEATPEPHPREKPQVRKGSPGWTRTSNPTINLLTVETAAVIAQYHCLPARTVSHALRCRRSVGGGRRC